MLHFTLVTNLQMHDGPCALGTDRSMLCCNFTGPCPFLRHVPRCQLRATKSATSPRTCASLESCRPEVWTRRALVSFAAALLAGPAYGVPPTSPYEDAKSMQYGLDSDRRIRSCPGAVNPNCISTRSISQVFCNSTHCSIIYDHGPMALATHATQMYSPAWRAAEPNPHIANLLFENALKRVCPEAQVIRQAQLDNADFRAFSVPGLYGQDIIEVMIRANGTSDRNWENDDGGPTVTFRSMATQVKYIWPLQAPLADGGAQRKRLDAVRKQLGWRVIGCDYIECFS